MIERERESFKEFMLKQQQFEHRCIYSGKHILTERKHLLI